MLAVLLQTVLYTLCSAAGTYLHQRTRHPVQELLGEACSVGPAGGVDHLLAAVKVPLEAAAQNLHVVVLLVWCGDLSLQ